MISVQHGPDELAIRVADNGSGEAPSPHRVTDDVAPGAGRGILGMQERCRLLGGEATASRRPEGGFEVLARLPLTPVGTGR